jgi:predicted transcriptional regulator
MARASRQTPPPLELLCLRALWTQGEGSVKDVRQAVEASRPLAYTTIMTVLERLVRKGKLGRRKVGRAFVYSPTASRDDVRQVAVRELLAGFFDGSEAQLLAFIEGSQWRGTKASAAAVGAQVQLPPPQPEPEQETRLDTALL